eukprot:CAMPEP_0183747642 /NCGR_PEP_ID=MMETSP0737-20130205/67368_1 /TAXON_ID=385413 /ORGANISM="Thalassiosira miniscula, Strain CCMP1093" /LENGTH=760 /DNA_ID=CAMNT_0025983357 /DNA_START=37 /DNA_END=2316 /DNA_ORIENTATION=+
MARSQHRRKRVSCRRTSASLAAATLFALLTHGAADLALATHAENDSSLDAKASEISYENRRRTRAEGSIRGGSGSSGSSTSNVHGKKVNFLVKYKDGHVRRNLNNIDGNDNDDWRSHTSSISIISEDRHIDAVEVDEDEVDYVLEEMKADVEVELVEEDFPMYKLPYNSIEQFPLDSDMHRQLTQQHNRTLAETQRYGVAQTQAPQVWAATKNNPKYPNTPVKVCIVDTGYDRTHEDLPQKGVTGTNTGYGPPLTDEDGHGTHVAGVIGAVGKNGKGIVGINPDPNKFSFHISKALNDEGLGTATSVLMGIKGCISSGAKIISMSLGGGPKSNIFRELYKEAYDKGILVFAAAGNLGIRRDDFPASYGLVVSVGAVGQNSKRADFSNWSSQLEIMGPGVDIVSTFPGNKYGILSGTSMATPYVAGVAALVWGHFPQCTNQQIRNVLARSAKPINNSGGGGCSNRNGWGLVQAKDAFDLLDKYGCAAGGKNFSPQSAGAVGGCNQPLADISKLTPRKDLATHSNGASNRCQKLLVKLLTDDYAYETSWELRRKDNGQLLNSGPPTGRNFADKTEYMGAASECLEPGTYEFIVKDLFGDGIASPGYYSIIMDGKTLAKRNDFGPKDITTFTIDGSQSIVIHAQPQWKSLLIEGFGNRYGNFNDGGSDALHLDTKFGRNGLVMLKSGSSRYAQASVYSNNVLLNNRVFNEFKVVFSFYTNGMENTDKFCLDYSANGATAWSMAHCWQGGQHFENGEWNDDVEW